MISNIFTGEVQFERPEDVSTAQYQLRISENTKENWNPDQVTARRQVFLLCGFDPTLPLQNHSAVNAHGYVVGLSMDPVILRLSSVEQHNDRIAKWDEITRSRGLV